MPRRSRVAHQPADVPDVINGDYFNRTAGRVNRPLHACSVLDDGGTRVVVGVIDRWGDGRETLDAVKALASKSNGIPPGRMMLACTHTHIAPSFGGLGADVDPH